MFVQNVHPCRKFIMVCKRRKQETNLCRCVSHCVSHCVSSCVSHCFIFLPAKPEWHADKEPTGFFPGLEASKELQKEAKKREGAAAPMSSALPPPIRADGIVPNSILARLLWPTPPQPEPEETEPYRPPELDESQLALIEEERNKVCSSIEEIMPSSQAEMSYKDRRKVKEKRRRSLRKVGNWDEGYIMGAERKTFRTRQM